MTIAFSCSCGENLRVKDELAGKKVKCPVCQAVLIVARPVVQDFFKVVDPEPEPVQPKKHRYRNEPLEDDEEPAKRPPERKKRQGPRGCLDMLVFLGTGLLLVAICAGVGVGGWFYFFNFTGSELVGTWETDPTLGKDHYGQLRFNRFGDVTVMPPGKPASAKGNWRVLSKKDTAYVIEITNADGSGKIEAEITVLTKDRIRVALSRPAVVFELRRID